MEKSKRSVKENKKKVNGRVEKRREDKCWIGKGRRACREKKS